VQSAAERLTQQLLSDLFDMTSEAVGKEGLNRSRVVSERSLKDSLVRLEVQEKLFQVCPALKALSPHDLAPRIMAACPKHFNRAGLMRQEFVEACLALKGELSMNHFVTISMSLAQMEKHVEHDLVHLNKHQRKMNRRFLKLRHRLRKVYHFDGAPRKIAEMVTHLQQAGGGGGMPMLAATNSKKSLGSRGSHSKNSSHGKASKGDRAPSESSQSSGSQDSDALGSESSNW